MPLNSCIAVRNAVTRSLRATLFEYSPRNVARLFWGIVWEDSRAVRLHRRVCLRSRSSCASCIMRLQAVTVCTARPGSSAVFDAAAAVLPAPPPSSSAAVAGPHEQQRHRVRALSKRAAVPFTRLLHLLHTTCSPPPPPTISSTRENVRWSNAHHTPNRANAAVASASPCAAARRYHRTASALSFASPRPFANMLPKLN
jgi:hypothetical protein